MIRIAIFASGKGSNAEALIHQSRNLSEVKVVTVVADRESAGVVERCKNLGHESIVINPINFVSKIDHENEILKVLINKKIDWIFLCGYMRILSPHFLQAWSHFHGGANQIVNIHPSLLPDLRGADSLQKAWEIGLEITGVTLHLVDEGVDTGPILDQKRLTVDYKSGFLEYESKMHALEHEIYSQFLVSLSKGSPKTVPLTEHLAQDVIK